MSALVSVIVPCAGKGTRFGASYPKEMHIVGSGWTSLDRALAPCFALGRPVRVVAVIDSGRSLTVDHLAQYSDLAEVYMVLQPASAPGLAGAVSAAGPLLTETCLLVLPDQGYDDPGGDITGRCLQDAHSGALSVIAAMRPPETLATDGALYLVPGPDGTTYCVQGAEEKPQDPSRFNAAWISIAFPSKRLASIVAFLHNDPQQLLDAPAHLVSGYEHLSTSRDA